MSGYEELLPSACGEGELRNELLVLKTWALFVCRSFYVLLPHYLSNLLQFYVCVVLQMDCP